MSPLFPAVDQWVIGTFGDDLEFALFMDLVTSLAYFGLSMFEEGGPLGVGAGGTLQSLLLITLSVSMAASTLWMMVAVFPTLDHEVIRGTGNEEGKKDD